MTHYYSAFFESGCVDIEHIVDISTAPQAIEQFLDTLLPNRYGEDITTMDKATLGHHFSIYFKGYEELFGPILEGIRHARKVNE